MNRTGISGAVCVGLWLAAAGAIGTRSLAAQERQLVLQHGGNSGPETWATMIPYLRTALVADPRAFNTTSNLPYDLQANNLVELASAMAANAIAIGHSNGGIVSRQANRSRPWAGIITVATPHHGLILPANIANGSVNMFGADVLYRITRPIDVYHNYWVDHDDWWVQALEVQFQWFWWFQDVYNLIPYYFGATNAGLIPQMVPGSGFLQDLNGQANINRESGALAARVGIVSTIPYDNGIIFRAMQSHQSRDDNVRARDAATALYWAFYVHYFNYENWEDPDVIAKRENADLWADGAATFQVLDLGWCYLIGAYYGIPGGNFGCMASDAIVPELSQRYPGATRIIEMSNVSHMEETSAMATYGALMSVLTEPPFSIPLRAPSSTLNASITPFYESIYSPGLYTVTANATGGNGSFTYEWEMQHGSSLWQSYGVTSDPNFTFELICGVDYQWVNLRVTVRSGTEILARDMGIYVSMPPC